MDLKKLALAAAAGATLFVAAPAFAQPPHWAPAHGWRAKHHQPRHHHYYYRAPAHVYYQPRPVYVPPPVAYYPPPPVVYYPPPRPVIYGQIPLDRGTRIGFALGL